MVPTKSHHTKGLWPFLMTTTLLLANVAVNLFGIAVASSVARAVVGLDFASTRVLAIELAARSYQSLACLHAPMALFKSGKLCMFQYGLTDSQNVLSPALFSEQLGLW